MAAVAASPDQTTELLQNLSLDSSQPKPLEIPDPAKTVSVYQYGSVDSGVPAVSDGQVQSADQQQRSVSPFFPDAMDPTVCYLTNGYASPAYYYGSYNGTGNEWDENSRYVNADGVEMTSGVYGENGSIMYSNGYVYGPYAPYSPATSPVPTVGNDSQLYGPQHYQYPPYFQPLTASSMPFTPTQTPSAQAELSTSAATDKKPSLPETGKGNTGAVANGGGVKGNNGSTPYKPTYQNSSLNLNNACNGSALSGSIPASAYQDPRFCYDGQFKNTKMASFSKTNNFASSRNYNFRQSSNYVGLQHPGPLSMGSTYGFMNKMYPNKYFGQYGNNFRSGVGFGSGYDSRINANGWLAVDRKYKSKGRVNAYFGYRNDNADGFNELNRGPRAKGFKNQKGFAPVTIAVKGQDLPASETAVEERNEKSVVPDREQYNKADFPEDYADAKFFIIKSYSEDDVHKSIKYNVWASTPNGNKKLDAAYQAAQQKSGCPIFLFFSVNTSGQFVGLAEMVGPVDFQKNVEYWQQDKWTGCFPLKWHIVKDVPNNLLKHITLENNENKPVTNSRDTQDVKLDQGLRMIKIFKDHSSRTCILDDFEFYERRQKIVQDKKAKQQQFHKQVLDVKCSDDKDVTNASLASPEVSNVVSELKCNGEVKHLEDGPTKAEDASVPGKQVASEKKVLANGIANGC